MPRLRLTLTACLAACALAPAGAEAVEGPLILTGTDGREDVKVDYRGPFRDVHGTVYPGGLVISPPVVSSSPVRSDGTSMCTPMMDGVSQRVVGTHCHTDNSDKLTITVNLAGGNDSLTANLQDYVPVDIRALGGLGNDVLVVRAMSPRSLAGGDGDDTLVAPVTGNRGAALDGGTGRDLVDYVERRHATGVRVDLVARTATMTMRDDDPRLNGTRTDGLVGIERVSGTELGDLMIGSAAGEELIGGEGPDVLDGGDGPDVLSGGPGSDRLVGAGGADTLDGGDGADEIPNGPTGGDTYLIRDGTIERIRCLAGDVVVNDLADVITDARSCSSIQTAAAKHRFDTLLTKKPLRLRGRTVSVPLECPREKTEACAGVLRLRLGGTSGPVLGRRRYHVGVGRLRRVKLRLSGAEAARLRGRRATLDAAEVDADGRARRIVVATRARR